MTAEIATASLGLQPLSCYPDEMILFATALPAVQERPLQQAQPVAKTPPTDRSKQDDADDDAIGPGDPANRPPSARRGAPDPGVQAAADGRLVRPPVWRRRPTPAEIQEAYPAAALADGVGGQAYLNCEIEADSTLSHCVAGDVKGGYGFGAAALSLAASFRIRPETIDGDPVVRGRVVAPIRFDPPDDARPVKALWVASPVVADVRAATPRPGGKPATGGGRGVMRCTVSGAFLSDCRPAGDKADPFSRAAVKLAPQFSIYKNFANGRPTDGSIFDIPVIFDAPGAPPPAPVLENPVRFIRAPTNAQKNAVFPQAAKDHGVTTVAVTEACILAADGSLNRCKATREQPVGLGGAEAASRLLNAFQLPTWSAEGRPLAGAAVTVDLVWAPSTTAPLAQALSPASQPAKKAAQVKR